MAASEPTLRPSLTGRALAETHTEAARTRAGVLYAIAAYGAWGVFPVYFKAVKHVAPLEVLTHRVIWSVVLLAVLLAVRGRWSAVAEALRSRRALLTLVATTTLIGCNWLLFIWAIAHDRLLEASLGYFINPLVSVVLGVVFLRERLRPWQTVSVTAATAAVGYLTLSQGHPPLIALVLAGTFGFYGLLRKTVNADALVGLVVETGLLAPLATGYLLIQIGRHEAVFASGNWRMDALLILAGVITATPLLWFTEAARRLRLATMGFLQYLSPTGHFLLAVVAYHEPFTRPHLLAFAVIWAALAVYSVDTARTRRS